MASQTLVLDASVAVKWFSADGEAHFMQARGLLSAYSVGRIDIIVPDLFFHEIANALVNKKDISINLIDDAINTLYDLQLTVLPVTRDRLLMASHIARQASITEYDACYAALAIEHKCPLVTADSLHHSRISGCDIIPIEKWR